LQVISHLDLGGAEEVAIGLAEQLRAQYDFHFFAVNGVQNTPVGQAMKRRLDAIGVPVHSGSKLELKRGGFLLAAARLAGLIWKLRPDVVHLHTEIPELTHALSGGFLRYPADRSPALTRTLHNTSFWGPWQRMGVGVERRLQDVPVAAVSQAALAGMQIFRDDNALSRLAPTQSRVIYNGVSPVSVQRPSTRASGPVRVLFAGRLEPQKGADLLPDLLAQANLHSANPSAQPAAELNIYGAGSLGPELERWANQGVPGWTIQVLPPTPELRRLMTEHDLLLMPSRFEGLGLVAAEALIAGLPVIGTQIAGLDEVFPAGYPLLARSEDTAELGRLLAGVLADPQQYLALAQGWSVLTSEKFGLARMAREYGELYQQLLSSRAKQPVRAGAL
jgi:glycosyltransferase involved in cell wall biosynthesis